MSDCPIRKYQFCYREVCACVCVLHTHTRIQTMGFVLDFYLISLQSNGHLWIAMPLQYIPLEKIKLKQGLRIKNTQV